MEISVPRDRDASFEPKVVAERQRRLTGVGELVISLSAAGLTHGEVSAHLREVYGAEVSKQAITAVAGREREGTTEPQAGLHAPAGGRRARRVRGILRQAGEALPGRHQALGERPD